MVVQAEGRPPVTPRLVVNADDYGYFSCVSLGILEGARAGAVTATGVLANSPRFGDHAAELRFLPELDVGVHLTLTFGRPLTREMAGALGRWGGAFPSSAGTVARGVATHGLPLDVIRTEWRAQVGRCLDEGLPLRFVNTHEHVHLLPPLRRLVEQLAREAHIPHVRALRPEWSGTRTIAALVRNTAFLLPALAPRRHPGSPEPLLLGVGVSGKLDLRYLERTLPLLRPGRTYELMCHPGRWEPGEVGDPRLLAYHRWEEELAALTSSRFRALCEERGIRLSRFRDLPPRFSPVPPGLGGDPG